MAARLVRGAPAPGPNAGHPAVAAGEATLKHFRASSQDAQNPWGQSSQTLRLASQESLNSEARTTPHRSPLPITPTQSPAYLRRQSSAALPPAAAAPSPSPSMPEPVQGESGRLVNVAPPKRSRPTSPDASLATRLGLMQAGVLQGF